MRRLRPAIFAVFVAFFAFTPREARAEVSSWLTFGGGYAFAKDAVNDRTDRAVALTSSIGVGSTPAGSFVLGGLARTRINLSLGTDISIGPRFATTGFARGDWGFAVDAAVVGRFWGHGDYGRFPLQGMLIGGAPWGLQLGVGADFWSLSGPPYAQGAFAVLELDFLRLTVMRQGSSESWWPNPLPAGGHYK